MHALIQLHRRSALMRERGRCGRQLSLSKESVVQVAAALLTAMIKRANGSIE